VKKLNFKNIAIKSRRRHKPAEEGALPVKQRGRGWRILARFLVLLLGFIAIALIAAPHIVLWDMNRRLAKMPEYYAHVEDIDIDYLSLTVRAKNIIIKKKNGKIKQPLIYVSQSTVNIDMEPGGPAKKQPALSLIPYW
jgi:hypothetical protein